MNHKIFDHIKKNNLESIKKLIESGKLDINTQNYKKYTLLNYSTYCDKFDISIYLISNGADVNTPDHCGDTPLHNLLIDGVFHEQLVELLLEHGADPYIKNNNGWTPIDYCNDKEEFLNLIRLTKLKELYK